MLPTKPIALLSLSVLLASGSAAPTESGPSLTTTSIVILSASPSPITWRASQVPGSDQFASLTGPTIISSAGRASTVYPGGFVWVPERTDGILSPFPSNYVPSLAHDTIVVTATTGTPPPVVTYHASQDPSKKDLTSKTTSDGTTFFPFGWWWAPVGPNLPPVLPTPPPEITPPEAQSSSDSETSTEQSCPSTSTPTITVIVSYPTNDSFEFETTTQTSSPSNIGTKCVAPEVTTTTTASFKLPGVFMHTGSLNGGPRPRDYPTVAVEIQKYLDTTFNSLGIGTADYAPTSTAAPGKGTCADHSYDKAIPSAAAFIKGLSPSFCADWSSKPTKAFAKEYTAKDVKSNGKRALALDKRAPPPRPLTADSYPGWSIDFDWKPKKVSDGCSKPDYCNNALSSLLSSCNGYSLADAYKGANIEDDCGTFTYSIKGYPDSTAASSSFDPADVTCDLPSVNDIGSDHVAKQYPQSAYEAAAHQFCYGGYNWNADPQNTKDWTATNYFWFDTTNIDPATKLPAYCVGASFGTTEQWSPASADLCKSGKGLKRSDSKIWVQVVPSPSQEGCSPIGKYKLPEGEQCYKKMMNVITTCMPEDKGGKVGVWKEKTSNGCWDWWLWGRTLT